MTILHPFSFWGRVSYTSAPYEDRRSWQDYTLFIGATTIAQEQIRLIQAPWMGAPILSAKEAVVALIDLFEVPVLWADLDPPIRLLISEDYAWGGDPSEAIAEGLPYNTVYRDCAWRYPYLEASGTLDAIPLAMALGCRKVRVHPRVAREPGQIDHEVSELLPNTHYNIITGDDGALWVCVARDTAFCHSDLRSLKPKKRSAHESATE